MFYRVSGILLYPEEKRDLLREKAAKIMRVSPDRIQKLTLYRSSLDARKGKPLFSYTVDVELSGGSRPLLSNQCKKTEKPVSYSVTKRRCPDVRPIVVGFGPAGMFASLLLAKAGLQPIVIERGKRVEERVIDVKAYFDGEALNTESNVQFGEGGAGTFSDGKLNTLLKDKNYRGRFVLEELVKAGAPEEILYQNKPHVGTDRLRGAVRAIREEIIRLGGSFYFQHRFLAPIEENGALKGIRVLSEFGEKTFPCETLFLGIGHSARDTFRALCNCGIRMEKKIFSVGVRIEHLQKKINFAQFKTLSPYLPAADYKLAVPLSCGKTLYTFCMCPGGVVVPSASEEGGVVVNGMSYHSRNGINANSALLLNVLPEELPEDVLSGFTYQRALEEKAYLAGGANGKAPCQMAGDFLLGRKSTEIGEVVPSYSRGYSLSSMEEIMPSEYVSALKEGIVKMGGILTGFDAPDAILTAVESRATCPVRLLRDDSFQSSLKGLYPIGEGAGYAGGIMSSAMDGMKAVEKYIESLEEIQ